MGRRRCGDRQCSGKGNCSTAVVYVEAGVLSSRQVSHSNKTASLTAEQFHRAFTNSLTETESLDAFKRYVVPAPNRVLLQTAFANFTSHTATTVNFRNDTRAPLLLVAGGKDRVVPSSIVKANFDLYRESKAETDYKEFPEQTHFTLLQED